MRIPGIVNGLAVSGLTVDSASNIQPCVKSLDSSQQPWTYVENSVLFFYRYHELSWENATLPKQRFPFPLIPNL